MVRVTNALLGWLPGGLAIVAVIACAMFTAFTGATGVTIVALGAVLYPALLQQKYGEKFSLGLLTASGSLGLILVPSMPLILYGVVAQQFHTTPPVSIDALFKAGILPCALMHEGFIWNGVTIANPFSKTPHPLLEAMLADADRWNAEK